VLHVQVVAEAAEEEAQAEALIKKTEQARATRLERLALDTC
jgi:hypothetical protein